MHARRIGKRSSAHGPVFEAPRSGHRRLRSAPRTPPTGSTHPMPAGPAGCGGEWKRSPAGSGLVGSAPKRRKLSPTGSSLVEPIASGVVGLAVPRREATKFADGAVAIPLGPATPIPSGVVGLAALPGVVPAGRAPLVDPAASAAGPAAIPLGPAPRRATSRQDTSLRGPHGERRRRRFTKTGLDKLRGSLDKAGVALMDEIGSLWIDAGIPATKARRFEKHVSNAVMYAVLLTTPHLHVHPLIWVRYARWRTKSSRLGRPRPVSFLQCACPRRQVEGIPHGV
jgi:hypothetical protein